MSTSTTEQSTHTCDVCRIVFGTQALARAHYQTEFHRYNLKRSVVELPPVTSADYEAKAALLQQAPSVEDVRCFLKLLSNLNMHPGIVSPTL